MKNRLKNINFYLTSIAVGSSIDNLVDSGTFVLKDTTVNGFSLTNGNQLFYVIIDADQTLKREVFRITNVDTATKIATFDKRISPNGKQSHAENALVQINDFAELFNYLSLHTDDAGYAEVTTGRYVKLNGGTFKYATTNVTISDTTLLTNPNTTNYLILDFADGTFKVVTSLTGLDYYLMATAVTNGTDVLSLTDNRSTFVGFDTAAITPSIQVGSVTTLSPTSNATVNNVGTTLAPIFNFGIPKGSAGNIATAPEGEAQTISDNIPAPTGTVVAFSDAEKWVSLTYADNSYDLYLADTNSHPFTLPSGIYNFDTTGLLLTSVSLAGTYSDVTHSITYSDGTVVSGITGNISLPNANVAYRSEINTFTKPQIFNDSASFKSQVMFPYFVNSNNTTTFNSTKGSKQKFNLTDASAHTLSFVGLRSGANYVFAINVSGGSAILNKATTFTACDTIAEMYSVGGTTYPLTLVDGVHLFVAEAFSSAIHVSYIGQSISA